MKRAPTWIVMAVLAVVLLVVAGTRTKVAATPGQRVERIAATIRCPVCGGESVAESNAPAARIIREEIARQVQQDRTDTEIRAAISTAFEDAQVMRPPASGAAALIWVLPVLLLAAGGYGIAQSIRRSRVE